MTGRFFHSPDGTTDAPQSDADKAAFADNPPIAPLRGMGQSQVDPVAQRVRLHHYLLDKINLALLDSISKDDLQKKLLPFVRAYVRQNQFVLNAAELESLIADVTDEMLGLGPLEALLKDETITDILVVGPSTVYIERKGKLQRTGVQFGDEEHLLRIINKIVGRVGRRVDEASPLVDARLPDGSRVNVAIRPVAVDGPQMSIRKFAKRPFSIQALIANAAMSGGMAQLLSAAVEGKVSVVISGGTGSGKTTLLNALSACIPPDERLVTIEDAAELQLQQPHIVRLETRPASLEGRNEVTQRDLVRNALRMRPDRIIVGEVRGAEAFDMLQAMNTGHDGSMTTIHANSPQDAISRLEQMVGMAGMPMTLASIRAQIASAIHLVVQTARMRDGVRRVTAISELAGLQDGEIVLRDIMVFHADHVDLDGNLIGSYQATGARPQFVSQINMIGVKLDPRLFEPPVDAAQKG
jgi:pilus assembly protein CpaF